MVVEVSRCKLAPAVCAGYLMHKRRRRCRLAVGASKSHRVAMTCSQAAVCFGAGRPAARLHLGVVTLAMLELVPAPNQD
jgi:hypothetical protein